MRHRRDPEPRRRRRHGRRPRTAGRALGPHTAAALARSPSCARVKVALLAGGFGGSRFALALAETAGAENLAVIGNVGDDVEMLGLHVSPDLDSVLYTLAGVFDTERGWGRRDETWNALETAAELGGEAWFKLGDRDTGFHLVRTEALRRGEPLSAITQQLAEAFGVRSTLLAGDRRPPPDARADAGRRVRVPGVVRGARAPRRGRRRSLRRRRDSARRARRDRGPRRRGRDPDRAEQPVRQHRADPCRAGDQSRARAPPRPGRRGQPADRRQDRQGAGRPDAGQARRAAPSRRMSPRATQG